MHIKQILHADCDLAPPEQVLSLLILPRLRPELVSPHANTLLLTLPLGDSIISVGRVYAMGNT